MHVPIDRAGDAAALHGPPDAAAPAARCATALLRLLALLHGVLQADAPSLVPDATVRLAAALTVLLDVGEPAATLYVVVDGRVRPMLGTGPRRRVPATMQRGDTVGLAALLRRDVYPVGAVVAADATRVGLPAGSVATPWPRKHLAARGAGQATA